VAITIIAMLDPTMIKEGITIKTEEIAVRAAG